MNHFSIYISIALLFVSSMLYAQDTSKEDDYLPVTPNNTENYIYNRIYQKAVQSSGDISKNADVIENISYFDGLGRPKQQIDIKASPKKRDIVTFVDYDIYGRQDKEYLPFVRQNGTLGNYIDVDIQTDIKNYYQNKYPKDFETTSITNINAYSEQQFEGSPLNRILKTGAPGASWALNVEDDTDHTIKLVYASNTPSEIPFFEVEFEEGDSQKPSLIRNGYYRQNQLYKTIIKDENWNPGQQYPKDHTSEEFKDKQDRVITKYVYDQGEAYATYYVYDDYGNLTYVISPKVVISDGVSDTELNELCYQYKYDLRNRLIEKKIPGKDWEYIVYNKLDQPVLTQDGNQRQQMPKEWLFTKYDAFGRVAYTGILHDNDNDRQAMQSFYDNSSTPLHEERVTSPLNLDGTGSELYYSNEAEPKNMYQLSTINYYDDYNFDLAGAINPGIVYSQEITTNTKTLATASKIRVLGTKKWITTVNYYDEKARLIFEYTNNEYLESINTLCNLLDFTGKITESKTTHRQRDNIMITTIDKFTYDHMGRLHTQKQTINTQPEELIVSNTYDELGMLIKKDIGGLVDKSALSPYTDVSHVVINEIGEIRKNHTIEGWNAGLATRDKITGDGKISFNTLQTNKAITIGLSYKNVDNNNYTIDYAMYLRSDSKIGVYEKGVNRGVFETYTTADLLSVERKGNTVYYQKNGKTFYTSAVTSYGTLLGDLTIYHNTAGIKGLRIEGDFQKGLQTIDYAYNVRGWLTQINHPNEALRDDLFAFGINYNMPNNVTTPLYNGNISQTLWKTANDNYKNQYSYAYDALNRLTKGTHNTGRYNVRNVRYDKNGNILSLVRSGWQNSTSYSNMDVLHYRYDSGNKLLRVNDLGNKEYGFRDAANTNDDFVYDVNGNMTLDHNKGISEIAYNYLNLPKTIAINNSKSSGTIRYRYDAMGTKLKKIVTQGSAITETVYDGNYIYENGKLQFFHHPEGYIEPESDGTFTYVYQYKDIWNNVRLTYSDLDGDGSIDSNTEILNEKSYYPFGLRHRGYNNVIIGTDNNYKQYQSQEFTEDLGLNTHEWKYRVSDPAIGRFWQIDPLAEDYVYNSTYAFQENKMGMGVELEGRELREWWNNATEGLKRVFVDPVKNAKPHLLDNTPTSTGPTKNITGNYFGDALYKLAGGETVARAIDGDPKAQFRVIGNTMLALQPGGRGVGALENKAASSALQAEVKSVASNTSKKVSTIIGGELKGSTSIMGAGKASATGNIPASLLKAAENAGGVGAVNAGTKSPVGCCAEFKVATELLTKHRDAIPSQIRFTKAIRPRTGKVVPPCDNCKKVFPQLDN